MKLTKKIVENAEVRSRQYTIWCSELRGFGVKINTAGTRSYFVDYRNEDGVRRRMNVGRHGLVTTEEARKLAFEQIADAIRGRDPQAERRERRHAPTLAQVCDRYLDAATRGLIIGRGGLPKKASTLAIDRGRIEQHIKPLLGTRKVVDLTRADVAGFIRDVTSGATARSGTSGKLRGRIRVTGGPGAAARTSGLLGGILSFAVSDGIIDANPAIGLRRPAGKARQRRLNPVEYAALGETIRLHIAEGSHVTWQGCAIIRLIALAGLRLGEAQTMRRAEVDIAKQIVAFADTKTGYSVRPLGRAVVEVIQGLPGSASPYLFPAPRLAGRPYSGLKRYYRGLFADAGLQGVTPHTLRHSFASVAADLGFADSTIGACLGHSGRGVTSRYTHVLDKVLVEAANTIAAEINRLMGFR
ncbi:MAG: site-specific integrase [Devosia sp.]